MRGKKAQNKKQLERWRSKQYTSGDERKGEKEEREQDKR